MTTWQEWPARLWGRDWIAPMSEVLGINRRTIERWRAGDGEPNAVLHAELKRLATLDNPRAVGNVLRRMANDEELEDIRQDIRDQLEAATRIEHERGKFSAIDLLAS